MKQASARHTYCISKGPPRNAGEVSCPGSWAGNTASHIPLPSPDPQEDQRQRAESRCVLKLKIFPADSAGVTLGPLRCRILCLLLLSPSDPWLRLLVAASEFRFALTWVPRSASTSVPSPSRCEPASPVPCVRLCERLHLRGVDWKQSCGLACGQTPTH